MFDVLICVDNWVVALKEFSFLSSQTIRLWSQEISPLFYRSLLQIGCRNPWKTFSYACVDPNPNISFLSNHLHHLKSSLPSLLFNTQNFVISRYARCFMTSEVIWIECVCFEMHHIFVYVWKKEVLIQSKCHLSKLMRKVALLQYSINGEKRFLKLSLMLKKVGSADENTQNVLVWAENYNKTGIERNLVLMFP